ncbi:MAG TPA: hypothetical protein VN280_01730, partial [Variovorax sp.]|nr:hypothetical protein [Variovorax sp.]
MAAASLDLQGLLARLDPTAEVAQRHIWLIDVFDWLRGDRASPQAAVGRVSLRQPPTGGNTSGPAKPVPRCSWSDSFPCLFCSFSSIEW